MNDQDYDQELIHKYWNRYVAGYEKIPEHLEGLDDQILLSWKRSKQTVNPYESLPVLLNHEELEKLMYEKQDLIKIAVPYMIQFYEIAKDTAQNVLLTDERGKQLKNISSDDKSLMKLMEQAHVANGCDYGEETCGTSSVSMSLREDRPVLLRGYEHYRHIYHGLACFSMPIHTLGNKQVGCICVTGSLEKYRPFVASACVMMVHAIENELQLTQADSIMNIVVQNFTQGFLVLNAERRILQYNEKALRCLQLKEGAEGHLFDEFFINDFNEMIETGMKNQKERFQYVLIQKNQYPIPISLKLIPICENHQEDLYLMIFSSADEASKEASKILGYTAKYHFSDLHGESKEIQHVKDLGRIAAKSNSCVLIQGESGTGKELLAQAIHNESTRKDGPFITVRCGCVPKDWMEAEIFGDKDGRQLGKLELASGGTLFLDDIDQLSAECQIRLLNFLDTKATDSGKIMDVRLITCTQKDLLHLASAGVFRTDLYYKLNILNIAIPPLRQRRKDIWNLIRYYISGYRKLLEKDISNIEKRCMEVLVNYSWPGNVRELESTIECLINSAKGSVLCFDNLPENIVSAYLVQKYTGNSELQRISSPQDAEYAQIIKCLRQGHGHMKTAAALLDMPLSTLYRKCRKYSIDPQKYRTWE